MPPEGRAEGRCEGVDPHLRGQGKAGGTGLVGGSRPGGARDSGELMGCIRDLNSGPQA